MLISSATILQSQTEVNQTHILQFRPAEVDNDKTSGGMTDLNKPTPTSTGASRHLGMIIPQLPLFADTDTPTTAVNESSTGSLSLTFKRADTPIGDGALATSTRWSSSAEPTETSHFPHHPHHNESSSDSDDDADPTSGQPEFDRYSPVISSQGLLPPPATQCKIIVPAPIQARCPCCLAEDNCTLTFLRRPDGRLPPELIQHAAQLGINIPEKRQADPGADGLFPQCGFPGCRDRPKFPGPHISTKHLAALVWRCACNPSKPYSSRTSVNNHKKRVADSKKTKIDRLVMFSIA
jgi:hypothetical protein